MTEQNKIGISFADYDGDFSNCRWPNYFPRFKKAA